jgi:putative Mg2+ transporter-C (MgtC) family protein
MNSLRDDFFWDVTDLAHLKIVAVRLLLAAVLGGALGFEREAERKAAGLRTHMLVALGAALFVLAPLYAGVGIDNMVRVVQGLTLGIGFLGAGVIVKLQQEQRVIGLTTAATIWLTAATGMAVGLGSLWPPLLAVFLAWLVLFFLGRIEHRAEGNQTGRQT